MKKLSSSLVAGRTCRLVLTGLSLVVGAGLFSGCQTDPDIPVDRTAMLNKDDQVSNVPWNKPQGWEDRGQLGALANDPRVGGQQ